MHVKAVLSVLSCFVVLVSGALAVAAPSATHGLRVGGIAGWSLSEQEDINNTLDDLEEFWSPWEFDWEDEHLKEGPFLGAYAELPIGSNWAVGMEYVRLSSTGGYHWSDRDPYSTHVGADYAAAGNVASVYGCYRLPMGRSGASLRVGAGLGYVLGAKFSMDFTADQSMELPSGSRPDTTLHWQTNLEATGSGMALHGFVGVEHQLARNLMLTGEVGYRTASIDRLEVSRIESTLNGVPDDTLWPEIEEGETLRWNTSDGAGFSTQEGDEVGLDFSGVYFTLRVAYSF